MMDSASSAPESGSAREQDGSDNGAQPAERHALSLLVSHRPRNVSWRQAAGLLFGDWGTSRLYVLGLAFFFAGRTSFYLICGMSLLILAVGWAYTQICRIYPDGGGVYTAAKKRSATLAVFGALLLFADYTVTASLSVLDAFHYFNAPTPAICAVVAIFAIGAVNLLGPRHTGKFALMAAVGMVVITLVATLGAIPQVNWHEFGSHLGGMSWHAKDVITLETAEKTAELHAKLPKNLWTQFASIMLALSGVEAIANLTGVMKSPISKTSRKAIWVVAIEVAVFNVVLAACMVAIFNNGAAGQEAHRDDMMAFITGHYVGQWAEWLVRGIGGVLLLSAGNTAITDMISVQYLMARDGELPRILQKLNHYGVPWLPAIIAASVPAVVVAISPDVEQLSHLYAIGVIGAVAINVTLCAMHPRLHRMRRKLPMILLGLLLLAIWITLACTKLSALRFVVIVVGTGLLARWATKWWAGRRGPRPSLLRQAIIEQLTPDAMARPKILVGTYGSDALATAAVQEASSRNASLIVCFVRQVSLSYKWDEKMTMDTDLAAQKVFARYLQFGHEYQVPIIPVYDMGPDSAELMAEHAAVAGADEVIIGTSRRGKLHQVIRGSFQRQLESLLPREIRVHVVDVPASETSSGGMAAT